MEREDSPRAPVWALVLAAAALGAALAGAMWRADAAGPRAPLVPPPMAWPRGDPALAAIIRIECARYGIAEAFALCVADRESGRDPAAIGDRGAAVGLYQFHEGAWARFRREMGLPADDLRADARQAARTACWAFAHGYARRWTTVRIGLCQTAEMRYNISRFF